MTDTGTCSNCGKWIVKRGGSWIHVQDQQKCCEGKSTVATPEDVCRASKYSSWFMWKEPKNVVHS